MKKITKFLFLALIGSIALGAVACKNPDTGKDSDGEIIITPSSLPFDFNGGTRIVRVQGNNWTATPSDEWIEVMPEADRITVVVAANTVMENLTGTVVISNNSDSKTVTVTLAALQSTDITVSETRLEFPHQGDTKTVQVTSEREWTATSEQEWIYISKSADGHSFDVTLDSSATIPQTVPDELNGTIVVSNGVAEQNKTISVWQALGVQSIIMYPHNVTVLYPSGTARLELLYLLPENATDKRVVWESLNPGVVTVDQNGNLTPVSLGSAVVTVTTVDVDLDGDPLFDDCLVIVAEPWTPGTVSFRSNTVWPITLEDGVTKRYWSDTVLASNAEKDTYTGVSNDVYIPDAMRNGSYGHMFSWKAVDNFGTTLCPSPWRVPTVDDFIDLDKALGGTGNNFQSKFGQEDKYREQWGLEWAGQAFNSMLSGGGENDRANGVAYWSATDSSNVDARALGVTDNSELGGTPNPQINPQGYRIKQYGYLLRCVKDVQ